MKENSVGNEEDLFASFWKAEAEENGAEREFESVDKAMERLGMSRFRSRFSLNEKEKEYVRTKGMAVIKQHAAEIVRKRLAPAEIRNDGKQTPMRHGLHPVFIAQHATACCCRGCFEKMARHSQRRKAFAIRAGLCRESYNGVDQEADRRKSVMPGHERRVIAKTSARAANVANFMVAK